MLRTITKRLLSFTLVLSVMLSAFAFVSEYAGIDVVYAESSDLAAHEVQFIEKITGEARMKYCSNLQDWQLEDPDISEISAKANELTAECSSDEQKLRTIHDWLATNIAYDYVAFESNDNKDAADPIKAFHNGRAVCDGYARLTRLMLLSVGVPCVYVCGYAAGLGTDGTLKQSRYSVDDANHAWDAVLIDGQWKIIDVTWDSQNEYHGSGDFRNRSDQNPRYDYYEISPEAFSKDHYSVFYNDLSFDIYSETGYSFTCTVLGNNRIEMTSFKTKDYFASFNIDELDGDKLVSIKKGAFKKCKNLKLFVITAPDKKTYKKIVKLVRKAGWNGDFIYVAA